MSKAKKFDEIAILAETMIGVLNSRRQLGGDDYPPTLRQLAELSDLLPEDDRVLQAIAKKPFKDKAKVSGKPLLDSPVYFTEDVPRKPTKEELKRAIDDLAERMLEALASQRSDGENSYPATIRTLAELSGVPPEDDRVLKAVGAKPFKDKAKVMGNGALDAPVCFKEDEKPIIEREVARLAERMLRVLESQRSLGDHAYPTALHRLAELSGVSPEDKQVLKAAGHKSFKEKTKADPNGRLTLDSTISIKVKSITPADLATRMLQVLESQRNLVGDAYPTTLRRLAELCDQKGSDNIVPKAATHANLADLAVIAGSAGKGKPALDAPVILKCDLESGLANLMPALLKFAHDDSKNKDSHAFSTEQLKKKLHPLLQEMFAAALDAAIEGRSLPPGYAWVLAGKKPLLFLLSDLQPTAPQRSAPSDVSATPTPPPALPPSTPSRDFAVAFREAFERLDRRNGLTNFVKLIDLRRELADFDRDRFDAGLRQLRIAREFSLDSHEGLLKPLTPEEREAGIAEAGSLLVYVSRR
jgi:hypothetical protein